jgi:hypothetical protein
MIEAADLENLQKLRDATVKRRRYVAKVAIEMCAINNKDLSESGRCPEIVALQVIIDGLDQATQKKRH